MLIAIQPILTIRYPLPRGYKQEGISKWSYIVSGTTYMLRLHLLLASPHSIDPTLAGKSLSLPRGLESRYRPRG